MMGKIESQLQNQVLQAQLRLAHIKVEQEIRQVCAEIYGCF